MATRSFTADDETAAGIGPIDRATAGAGRILRYQLNVVASTTEDVVRSAGGWLCDRARAGWDVNVLVADGGDPRPLAILGATALDLDEGFVSMVQERVASRGVGGERRSPGRRHARARGDPSGVEARTNRSHRVGQAVAGRARSSGRPGPAPGEPRGTGVQVARPCRRRCFVGFGHPDRDAVPTRNRIIPPAALRLILRIAT